MKERKQFLFPALIAIGIGMLVYAILTAIQPMAAALGELGTGYGIAAQTAGADAGNIFWALIYSFVDFSEGAFFADTIATVGMFVGAAANLYLEKMHSPHAGTGSAGAGGKWAWLVTSQFIAMFLANVLFRYVFGWEGFFVSFIPLVSVLPAAILGCGKPNVAKAATGIICSMVPVWATEIFWEKVTIPMGLPGFAAFGIIMPIATLIFQEIFKLMPWMNKDTDNFVAAADAPAENVQRGTAGYLVWTRVFGADISELNFWGMNLSGLGLFIGGTISFMVTGAAGFPLMVLTFIATSALGMIFWGPWYQKEGYAFTFEANLIGYALIGTYNPVTGTSSWGIVVAITIISALIGAPLLRACLKTKFFQRYLACVPVQLFAGIIVWIAALILNNI